MGGGLINEGDAELRELFDDDLLIKTSGGMDPTPLAIKLAPRVRRVLDEIARAVEDSRPFDAISSTRACCAPSRAAMVSMVRASAPPTTKRPLELPAR